MIKIALAIGVVAGIIIIPLAPPVLGAFGFSSIGPVSGSLAAAWQSAIGATVAAGSLFAMAQAVGMGASVPAVMPLVTGAVVSLGTCVGLQLWKWAKTVWRMF